jgi:gas vesicle structural protein
MSVIVDRHSAGGYVERRRAGSSLADVVDLILDKGMIIDIFVRVSLLGLEILTIDIRIVVASVDTFLQFAEAANRVDLYRREKRGTGLPEVVHAITGKGDEADGKE